MIAGTEDLALVTTDRRCFVAQDGVLVTDPATGLAATWPLDWVRRVTLASGTSSGAVVLTGHDGADRPLVIVLGRPHLERAEAAVTALRARLAARGNFEPES